MYNLVPGDFVILIPIRAVVDTARVGETAAAT
jgi:hypothetical protein